MMGGQLMIRVESVRVVDTNKNYQDIFHALFLVDLMVSNGQTDHSFTITDGDIDIINGLFVKKNMSSLDKYVIMTVKSFVRNKNQITLRMDELEYTKTNNKGLMGFFIEDKVTYFDGIKGIDFDKIELKDNLLSSKIFDMFPYATNIIIDQGYIGCYYIFNLFMFLEIIYKSNTSKTIKVQQLVPSKNASWLCSYYNKCSSSLKSEHQKHGLTITFQSVEHVDGPSIYLKEYLLISRLE